jgi:hypothetical protein
MKKRWQAYKCLTEMDLLITLKDLESRNCCNELPRPKGRGIEQP